MCDHAGRRRFLTWKGKKRTLVANVAQHAVMRVVQENECRVLQEAIECRNERHKRLMSIVERQQKLMGEILEFPKRSCLEVRVLDDKTSEDLDLQEKKQTTEGLLKEVRNTEVEEWRGTVAVDGVAQRAAAGSRSSRAEGDLLLSEVGVLERDSKEEKRSFGQVKAPPQKRRAATRALLAETILCCSTPRCGGKTRKTWRS